MRESTARAQAKYKARVVKPLYLALHKEIDKDIIDKLETVPSKQGYIKQLVRDDIKKNQ